MSKKWIKRLSLMGCFFLGLLPVSLYAQSASMKGSILNEKNQSLRGVVVTTLLGGQTVGKVQSDSLGTFTVNDLIIGKKYDFRFDYVGYETYTEKDMAIISHLGNLLIRMKENTLSLDEVVVVGYGTQKRQDITGSVASLSGDRLEMLPNVNLYQAIAGAIPGVNVTTSTAGAAPSQSIMVGGRRSITASNSPLVIIDGTAGNLGDISPNDVSSIEVLKDASAAAIYGSRGSNGVILVTTKSGTEGKAKLSYNGYYSTQRFAKIPDILKGEDFYAFKKQRIDSTGYDFTPTEIENYQAGKYTDWVDLALRNGQTMNHVLSLSGGFKGTKYYISGGVVDINGLAINDNYKKYSSRLNLESKFKGWFTIGTKTQLYYINKDGIAPTWDGDQGVFWTNPLTTPYDSTGNLTVYPWPEDTYFSNPLMGTLATDYDRSYQFTSNNYAIVDFPFLPGLQYRINAGFTMNFSEHNTYYGRNTKRGLEQRGEASMNKGQTNNTVIENMLNFNRTFGKHSVFVTGLYSFENYKSKASGLDAQGFPNDFRTWYSSAQADSRVPDFSHTETTLLSSMLRINYSYDNRYLLTLTERRDGYSGFGAEKKWGTFPSVAAGWNISKEDFFKWDNLFSSLKLRVSWGINGNQAISAYQTISRLASQDIVSGTTTLPGYIPKTLGQDNLGWESTRTLNFGLDFGILNDRITGDINVYKQNTYDLILARTISPVYAVGSITQNIGQTENKGLDLSLVSQNIITKNFTWQTEGNISFIKNKIVSLYGIKDANGNETDDVANRWFIGQPIALNYGFKWDGVWQLNEAAEAATFGTQPGYIKIKDVSGPDGNPDGKLSPEYDRVIIGQRDPKFTWGMSNIFTYKNFTFRVFIQGVQGVTKENTLLNDRDVDANVRMTTTKKNWWTPTNPTNDWYMNKLEASLEQGQSAAPYENASFVRVKDITLAYSLGKPMLSRIGIDKLQFYVTATNMFTLTKFKGMDPELSGQRAIPLQKEYVLGLNLDL